MKNSISQQALIVAAMALTCLAGDPFAVPWYTIDSGGILRSESDDGVFVLSGTIGQPDAGPGAPGMTGQGFAVSGGFWFESPSGDCNANGFVDLGDHAAFVDCMTIPEDIGPGPGCECYDIDGDGRIDLADFAENQRGFIGD